MKAIVQDRYGAPEQVLRLAEVEVPEIGDDDVVIRTRATSVNTPDWITVSGTPYLIRLQAGIRRPPTPVRGTDVAGLVEKVGRNVTDFEPGDEVFGSWWADSLSTQGTFAEFTVGPAAQLAAKPGSVSFEEAAAAGMSGLTALAAMRDVADVQPRDRVLINGASGGVGTFAVQIAKLRGAHVTGVCSTKNIDLVRSLGADHVIDYTEEDFTQGEERYEVILDNVMNHSPRRTIRALASGGKFLPNSAGTKHGFLGGLPRMARAGLMAKSKTDVRFIGDWSPPSREDLDALAHMLESGVVTAVVDTVYPLKEAARAVVHMMGHHAGGNIVVTI